MARSASQQAPSRAGGPKRKPADAKPEEKTFVELKRWKTNYNEMTDGKTWHANLMGSKWSLRGGEVEEGWNWKPEADGSNFNEDNGKGKGKANAKQVSKDKKGKGNN